MTWLPGQRKERGGGKSCSSGEINLVQASLPSLYRSLSLCKCSAALVEINLGQFLNNGSVAVKREYRSKWQYYIQANIYAVASLLWLREGHI